MPPINWSAIPMTALALLAGLAFISSLIGNSVARNPFVGAILTVIIFAIVYVGWNYYPHGLAPGIRFPG